MYYFDNAATTKVDPEILKIANKYDEELYYNPSSLTRFSLEVAKDIESARKRIASVLSCRSDEILFTSGGTESDNTALFGALHKNKGNIVTAETEHSAVYKCVNALKNKGYEIRFAAVNSDGSVNAASLADKIDGETLIAAVMHVNNETGAVNDIGGLAKAVKAKNPKTLFFSDGIQAAGKIKVNLAALGVDLYAFSGQKFHAPKGIGGLFVRKGVTLNPLHFGGGQEHGLRSGTENVAGIIAMSFALEKAASLIDENVRKFNKYKNILISEFEKIGGYKVICEDGSPAILSAAFSGIKSQVLSNLLEQDGVAIGLGSACSAKNKRNRIMDAINLDKKYLDGVTRISFSKFNTAEDVEFLAKKMAMHIEALRKL